MNTKIESEEEFQDEIHRLQTIFATEGASIMRLYEFVKNDNSYRHGTIIKVDKSNNETLRQLGMLDTYNGEDNDKILNHPFLNLSVTDLKIPKGE